MKTVCSWCRQEGKVALMGEKPPLQDKRETHGICLAHRHEVEARWQASIHTGLYSGIATGSSSALFHWTSVLNVTEKMRP